MFLVSSIYLKIFLILQYIKIKISAACPLFLTNAFHGKHYRNFKDSSS